MEHVLRRADDVNARGVGGQEVSEWRFGQRFQLPIYAAIIEVFHTFQ